MSCPIGAKLNFFEFENMGTRTRLPQSHRLINSSERHSVVIAVATAFISECRAVTCCEGVDEGISKHVNEQMIK